MLLADPNLDILQTLVNRVIPADDYPDGWEAGVGDYLLAQFEGDLKLALPIYRAALPSLDAEAQAAYGRGFAELDPSEQDAVLTRIETGKVATVWAVDPAAFFRMAINHCAEGYYSDPGNGGNKDSASWQMIGFEVRG